MTKLVLKEAYRKVGKRTYSLVQCPSCSSTRDVRVDALKDQQSTLCRSCVNRARTNNGKTGKFNRLDHYRTLEGHITAIWNGQRQRSKRNGWAEPAYSREELIEWVRNQPNASDLYTAWELSGYEKDRAPSIDRLDDYKPYSFDNIRLVDWETNRKKGSESQITGDNTKNCRAVRQLTMDGIPIQDFHSVSAATRALGISVPEICTAARGFRYSKVGVKSPVYSAGGYKWEYV